MASCRRDMLALVDGFAAIDAVLEQSVEIAPIDQRTLLVAEPLAAEFACQVSRSRLQQTAQRCDGPMLPRVVHHQLAILHIVSERHVAAHPDTAFAGRGNLVADPLADHLAFKLCNSRMFNVSRPIEVVVLGLGDRDEGDAIAVEDLDQLGEIHQRPRQTVNLVDHNHVDQTVVDVCQKLLETGSFGATGEPAIVIAIAGGDPTLDRWLAIYARRPLAGRRGC